MSFDQAYAAAVAAIYEREGPERAAQIIESSRRWEETVFAVIEGHAGFGEDLGKAREQLHDLISCYGSQYDLPAETEVESLNEQDLARAIVDGWWAGYYEHY